MESISVQEKGTVAVVEYKIDDHLDLQFKPGLFLQIDSFINELNGSLLSIEDHIYISKKVYSKIMGSI